MSKLRIVPIADRPLYVTHDVRGVEGAHTSRAALSESSAPLCRGFFRLPKGPRPG